jgi:hypothetical protein
MILSTRFTFNLNFELKMIIFSYLKTVLTYQSGSIFKRSIINIMNFIRLWLLFIGLGRVQSWSQVFSSNVKS